MSAGKPPDKPDSGDDSLDFSEIGPSRAPRAERPEPAPVDHHPQRPAAKRRRAPPVAPPRVQAKAARRRIGAVLIAIAIVAGAAFVMLDQEPTDPAPAGPAKPKPPPASQGAPVQKPAPSAQSPASPATPVPEQGAAAPTIPPEFLKAFKDYAARPASKAIALALDRNGRWSFGVIANHATQADADAEALAECTKNKAQSGIQENCRLYARGDKVVW